MRNTTGLRPDRLHHQTVHRACNLPHVFALRIAQGLAKAVYGLVDDAGAPQVAPANLTVIADNVSNVARLAESLLIVGGSWIKRSVYADFNQRSICGKRRLDSIQRGRL